MTKMVRIEPAGSMEAPPRASDASDASQLTPEPLPRQANEFVCISCHLVKNVSQAVAPANSLCLDCV